MDNQELCPVCGSCRDHPQLGLTRESREYFSCPLCGEFEITRTLAATMPGWIAHDPVKSTKISHAIRKMQEVQKKPYLNDASVKKILENNLPTPKEQTDLLIRWLGNNIDGPGEFVSVKPDTHRTIIGATTANGFQQVLQYLYDESLIEGSLDPTIGYPGQGNITLSIKGWTYLDGLKHGSSSGRKAFMAMQFGDPVLDCVYRTVFQKAVDEVGFDLNKLDEIPKAGLIDNRMRVEIQNCAFVIADLTHANNGAYWEAGYAEGLGKPIIYTCEQKIFHHKNKKKRPHFDTNHHLTIPWDENEPEKAGEELKASIRATLPHLAKMED